LRKISINKKKNEDLSTFSKYATKSSTILSNFRNSYSLKYNPFQYITSKFHAVDWFGQGYQSCPQCKIPFQHYKRHIGSKKCRDIQQLINHLQQEAEIDIISTRSQSSSIIPLICTDADHILQNNTKQLNHANRAAISLQENNNQDDDSKEDESACSNPFINRTFNRSFPIVTRSAARALRHAPRA
jgi:hypothetical protein